MTAPALTPIDARYTCTACGDCCRRWDVPLAPGEAAQFRVAAEGLVAPELLLRAIRGVRVGGEAREVLATRGGACVALDHDNLCRVHATRGSEAKPRACRIFPFTFVALGGETRVGVSFACPAVVDGAGPTLGEQREDIAALYQSAIAGTAYLLRLDEQVAFAPGQRLAAADGLALVGAVAEALRLPGAFVERVARAGATCALVQLALEEGRPFAAALERARGERERLAAEALAQPATDHRLGRALLRSLVASSAPTERGLFERIGDAFATVGGGRVRVGDGAVALSAVARVRPGVGADGEELLGRWLGAMIEGLTFFGPAAFDLSITAGLDLLALCAAGAVLLARAHTAQAGRDQVALDDVKRGVRLIESSVHHRASMPSGFERVLGSTNTLDLLRLQLG